MFIMGTVNSFFNLFCAQESVLGKHGGTVLTTDATYQQMPGAKDNTIAVGTVGVDQRYYSICVCVASRENSELHKELFTCIFEHVAELVKEAHLGSSSVEENECNIASVGQACFGFRANASSMRDMIGIVGQLRKVRTWAPKIDVVVVDGQEAPRIALRSMFPKIQIVDCTRHVLDALRRSVKGKESKLRSDEEKKEMQEVISAISDMLELTETSMKVMACYVEEGIIVHVYICKRNTERPYNMYV
jgi:hypothetical protein